MSGILRKWPFSLHRKTAKLRRITILGIHDLTYRKIWYTLIHISYKVDIIKVKNVDFFLISMKKLTGRSHTYDFE